MSDESSGAGQSGALPPRDNITSRPLMDHHPVRIAQVAGTQFVITSHGMPALTQISSTNVQGTTATLSQGGLTRIISLTPSRTNNQSTLRPSVANQNIVNALIKSRPTTVKTQLYTNADSLPAAHSTIPRLSLKRSSTSSLEDRDSYSAKVRRLIDHRNVKSKIVREKYNEHIMEKYYLETSGNILDLPQFAKRPKTQHFLAYLKENVIDPKEVEDDVETPAPIIKSEIQTNASNNNVVVVATTSSSATIAPTVDSTKVTSSTSSATIKSRPSLNYSVSNNQEQIMEKAKQEAYVVHRVTDLQKDGLWSEKRLPKCQEMPRGKAHWDYLLEEMVWLAADFAQERKWKKAAAKKCAKMVQKYFQDKSLAAQKAEKAQEQHLRRVAAFCAKEVKAFWSNVEKLVDYKQNTRLAEKRKKAMDQQLRFIVDQTEKYSQLLAEGMNKSVPNPETLSAPSSIAPSRNNSDDEFQPEDNSSDDEETIAQEEARIDEKGQTEEVAALQRESEMDIETFLSELPKDYLENRTKITLSDGNDSDDDEDENEEQQGRSLKDEDFVIDSSAEEDDEDTIQEQESKEGKLDYKDELNDLKAENELSVEELRKKYANLQSVPEEHVSSDSDYEESSSDESDEEEDDASDKSEFSDVNMSLSDEDEENQSNEIGLKSLLDDSSAQKEGELQKTDNQDLIDDAAAIAESIQPKGNTLSSTSVVTPIPFLLKYTLREYQHIGLDWLVTMYERKLNGILADEMGLGKTIQTIALLAHLACEKANWGPHLIIVPTSVMLNWEMECKKWCPAFKILTYYGTQKERKQKRMGWTKPNAFHVCITSYKLVIQDHQSFRRKKWKYLILDEAQNIKNFKSQRWQLLLNFATQQRLLLTGTPLQNNLMELWSLMHFLMPNVFQSHREFKEWFSNPVTGMIEGNSEYNESIIKRLHKVLRPFLLRRLKCEVEKQMPKKYEHVVMCRLSKRQRFLYDDYMLRAKTRETLASGNLLSVINVLMQLRKVCNHPNLFEVRPTTSPFQCDGINWHIPSIAYSALKYDVWKHIDLYSMNFNLILMEMHLNAYQCYRMRQYQTPRKLIEEINTIEDLSPPCPPAKLVMHVHKLKPQPPEAKVDSTIPMPSLEVLKPSTNINLQTNIKFKIAPHQNLLHFVQQNPLKVFHPGGNQVNSVLKSEKVLFQPGVAQLVNTASGQHLLITPTSSTNLTNNSIVTTGGQRVTLLSSKQVITTSQGTNITKSLPKMQVVSIPTSLTTSTSSVAKNVVANLMKVEEDKETGKKTIGNKFINRLYSNQPHDVRWRNQKVASPKKHHRHSVNEGEEIQIKDYQKNKLELISRINERRCSAVPLYGKDLHDSIKVFKNSENSVWSAGRINCLNTLFNMNNSDTTDCLQEILYTPEERINQLKEIFDRFIFYVPAVQAPEPKLQIWHPDPSSYWGEKQNLDILTKCYSKPATCLHPIASAMITQFPDPRLIQYDCGKLQTLDKLLRRLKYEGHRVLIFTQMTKMLDVLEVFLNFHGHIYLRLDGSTKVDQRQILMERFNSDPRLFAFILSTRSGGIGVNLTGADTVIFYDSDWNPTMDAQAQDRCHRIGQTRDVHIYRLVSERTIEENILKKANQKRLLGDLAIEGGNFTTAYFKSTTIQDLFNIDSTKETAAGRMEEVILINKEREMATVSEPSTSAQVQAPAEDKTAVGALENALAACEDDQDVIAARTAKAEAVADLAEFDENIPLEDQEKEKEPEISKAEQEVENMVKQLTPIERYAMRFIEETEAAWSAEQLAAAEREIDKQKLDWEKNQLAALREEEERRAKELEEEQELITYSREDATNQIWVSDNTMEQMPMWCPPTPPHQDTDIYIDQTLTFLYDTKVMTESQLPPVYIKKELKRSRPDSGLMESRRPLKVPRKDDVAYTPRSLFERPTPALMKMRRDLKMQKYRSIVRPQVSSLHGGLKLSITKPPTDNPSWHTWVINEEMVILQALQAIQGLPLSMTILSPGHTPNWDAVSEFVNVISMAYRSPKLCRQRYDNVIHLREEGKQIFDSAARKKKNKSGSTPLKLQPQTKVNRPYRTSELHAQDNNTTYYQMAIQRHDVLLMLAKKRTTPVKPALGNPLLKNPKHAGVFNELGIDIDHPVSAVEVAMHRAERIAREKKNNMTEQQQLAQRMQLLKAAQIGGTQVVTSNIAATAPPVTTTTTSVITVVSSVSQPQIINQVTAVATSSITTAVTTANTPIAQMRTQQRIVGTPIQTQNVVSVAGFSPAQLQSATQRLMVSSTPGQAKTVVGGTTTFTSKSLSQAQFQMIRQATLKQQQLRLQAAGGLTAQNVKTTTVTIGGQPAVQVQFTQAQPRTQFVKQGTVAVGAKQGIARPVGEVEFATLFKRQQLQQQKVLNAAAGTSQTTTIQSLSPQVFAQAIQQASTSGGQVATLVKTVPNAGGTQTVTIPVSGVTIGGTPVKATLTPGVKTTTPMTMRQLQMQQQLLIQKKIGNPKGATIAQGAVKGGVATQLIVGSKPLSTSMTMHQFQQVIRSPLAVQQGPVVLAKASSRVIPVNTGPGGPKQTIQVVASSQGLAAAIRPQTSSTLAGALAGIKVQGTASSQAQQVLLSQVSAALQNQVRQNSPVRLQTANGTPIVAVSVQSATNIQNSASSPQTSNSDRVEQVSRYMKK